MVGNTYFGHVVCPVFSNYVAVRVRVCVCVCFFLTLSQDVYLRDDVSDLRCFVRCRIR